MTSQLSKAAERLFCSLFVAPLLRSLSYGEFQFAYTPGRGARDAILFFVLTWLVAFSNGQRVAVYCSDVSGAFDRVSSDRLMGKLASSGIHPRILAVLNDWLAPQNARVVVKRLLFRRYSHGQHGIPRHCLGTMFVEFILCRRTSTNRSVTFSRGNICRRFKRF